MVSINNQLVYFYKKILTFLFPYPEQVRTFLSWNTAELATHVHVCKDAHRSIQSLFIYKEDIIRASIASLKYKGDTTIARQYAPLLAQHIMQTIDTHTERTWYIVPIPASKRRLDTYGFNQCEILCKAMQPHLDARCVYVPHVLERIDTHVSQTKLSRTDRLQNVTNVLRVHQGSDVSFKMHDAAIIIVDDVYTTGATAQAAIEACVQAGANTVVVWTLAH